MTETNAVTMPEHNDNAALTETPTLIVCEGDGGIEKGKAVLALAKREGIEDRVKMVAINSGSGKFGDLPDDAETVTLRTPERRFHEHDKKQRHYLKPTDIISGAHGSGRIRRIGRYHFDNPERVGSYHDQIRRTIVEFVEQFQNDPDVDGPKGVNIFQLVGAGGGTGSGVMPLITGLLHNILNELENTLQPGFEHWAVCSLATTSDFDGGGDAPDIHWRFPANSLALLDELRAITGYDDVDYPLRIPLLSSQDRTNNRRSAYSIDENPFSGVFLLRYNQDEAEDRTYRKGVGRTTARLVVEWMRKNQDPFEDLENEVKYLTNTFYEVRGASFEVPNERVRELLEVKKQYQTATQDVARITDEQRDIEAALGQLDIALDAESLIRSGDLVAADSDAREGDDEGRVAPEVMVTAFKRAEQVASNLSPRASRIDGIKDELSEFQDRRTYSFHASLDGDTVQRAIFMSAVLTEVKSSLRSHRFDTLVHEFVERHDSQIQKADPSFTSTAEPKAQFLQTIEPMLTNRIQALSSELDSMGLTGRLTERETYTSTKETIEQLRSTLTELRNALDERDQIAQLTESVENERDAANEILEATRSELVAAKERAESKLNTSQQRKRASKHSLDRHTEAIQSSPLGRFVTLPVASGAELSESRFENNPGITELIEDGVLDREVVVNRLQETLYDYEDGVLGACLETRAKSRAPSQSRPVVFCTESVRELIWEDAPSGTPPKTIASDEFDKQPETVLCTDDHRVGLLAVHGELSLDNFDHGQLRDSLHRGRPSLWGERIDLTDCYAYPELLPEDHPVSMQSQVGSAELPTWGEDR
ncbi:tubulin-like doman-containing protein [Haloferax prahovense]|uniref:tubulin-like doman-containing protein n=1 Tax=Haloferax prahovense TaxID=381852 RepID=UPI003C71A8FE